MLMAVAFLIIFYLSLGMQRILYDNGKWSSCVPVQCIRVLCPSALCAFVAVWRKWATTRLWETSFHIVSYERKKKWRSKNEKKKNSREDWTRYIAFNKYPEGFLTLVQPIRFMLIAHLFCLRCILMNCLGVRMHHYAPSNNRHQWMNTNIWISFLNLITKPWSNCGWDEKWL